MLTKNEFVRAINAIKNFDDNIQKLNKVNSDFATGIVEKYCLQDDMMCLLESAMEIPVDSRYGSIISWWIYEDKFGKNHWAITEENENGEPIQIYLNTPEDLYDYCKDMSIED